MNDDKKQLARVALKQKAVAVVDVRPYTATAAQLQTLRERFGVDAIDLGRVQFPLSALQLIPREIAERHRLLPIGVQGDALRVAMENPSDSKAIDELSFVVGKDIVALAVPGIDLEETLQSAYLAVQRGDLFFTGPNFDGPDPHYTGALSDPNFRPLCLDAIRATQKEASAPANEECAPQSALSQADFSPETSPAVVLREPLAEPEDEPEPSFEIPDLDLAGGATPRAAVVSPKPRKAPAVPKGQKAAPATGARILVVDDDSAIREVMQTILGEAGYRVTVAKDSAEAVEILKREPPALLVLDAMLPGMHGFELAQRLRASSRYSKIPIVMVSAVHRGWAMAEDLRRMGIVGYVEKPFQTSYFLRVLKEALSGTPCKEVAGAANDELRAGLLAFKEGDKGRALQHLTRAVELDPDAPALHFHLGLLLGQHGKLFEAIASMERALVLDERDFACIKNLAILYQQAGFVTKSAELWQRALPLAPDGATRDSIRERLLSLSS